ncbi:MAG TPA: hypothetical protein VKA07_11460 [Candidatus Sulfotelmatobacter sp.]|nr:hypothetical protein [Candidatus Sulfotelmatobacter sp.]
MKMHGRTRLLVVLGVLLTACAALGQVTPSIPYTVSVFATGVAGSYTKPDSITLLGNHVFIGYGNNVSTTGSDGKSSTIVEYKMNGDIVNIFSVVGHNDGLRVNPKTKLLWALQNEDANPNLVIIDPATSAQTLFTFGPTPHGGGYDDIAFRGNDVFLSASNPANNPNFGPAIVRATITGSTVSVSEVLNASAIATDIPTEKPVTLNLQDPDSMVFDPLGDLLLDSQADGELIIVHHAGFADQSVFHLGLKLKGAATQVDDTIFATSTHGVILVSDRDAGADGSGIVYAISKDIFSPDAAYTATPNSVGAVNFDTGVITNVVSGMVSPHGMAFVGEQF